jgi:hypothetical protein
MANVICGHCGTSNPRGLRFCENCDGFLDWESTPEDPVPEPEPVPKTVRKPAPEAAPPRRPALTVVQPSIPEPPRPDPGPTLEPTPVTTLPIPAPEAVATPAGRQCPACGTENAATRRFCQHCGTWLVTPTAMTAPPPKSVGLELKRRWSGDDGPYSRSLSPSTIAFRAGAGVVSVALLGAILTLAGWHPIRRITDEIGHVRGSGKVDNSAVVAASIPPAGLSRQSASWAVDDVRDRGWATKWTSTTAGLSEKTCAAPAKDGSVVSSATENALSLSFQNPLNVREIGIEPGLVAPAERTDRWQPRTLELHWKGGTCQVVNLKNSGGLQRFGVDQGTVRGVSIVVVAGYKPANSDTPRLDVGEVTFWQR